MNDNYNVHLSYAITYNYYPHSKKRMIKNIETLIILLLSIYSCNHNEYKDDVYIIQGRICHVLKPNKEANGKWIIRPAFFKEYDYVDKKLLNLGYHIAFYDVTDEFGNPNAQNDFELFYKTIRDKYHLHDKFIFEGFSRGGFFSLMYSISHPEQIEKIYLDAPVCDLYSWPKAKEPLLYKDAVKKWKAHGIPIDKIHDAPITQINRITNYNIPIVICYGEQDTIVPYSENFGRIKIPEGYPFLCIPKERCGHHPHSLVNCDSIVEFLDSHY